jgi:hypothetical protein
MVRSVSTLGIGTLMIRAYRAYSTSSSTPASVAAQPVKIYPNADLEKLLILKENKGKVGVYR